MKRIITLALAAGLFMGASVSAEAAEINVSGLYKIVGGGYDNLSLAEGDNSDFNVYQRAEFVLDIVNSENLSARFKVRVPGSQVWGDNTTGNAFNIGGGDIAVQLKSAYIDWIVPTTDVAVRMGLQPVALPNVMGSSVFDDDVAGVTVAVPFSDMVAMNVIWARPFDMATSAMQVGESTNDGGDTVDLFAVTLPVQMETVSFVPWAAFALAGDEVNTGSLTTAKGLVGETTWYAGFTLGLDMFDPFTMDFGFTYGASQDIATIQNLDASGWLAEAELAYATNYGTAKFFGWYGSGDENGATTKGEFGRLPEIDGGQGHMMSAFFDETAIGGVLPSTGVTTKAGTWAAGLGWYGYQPMEDLSLRAHVMYIAGTNNENSGLYKTMGNAKYLAYGDSVIELTAAANYAIYKDLMAVVELNYLISDIEAYQQPGNEIEANGYRASVGFQYNF